MNDTFFPLRPAITPTIYAYADDTPQYKGLLKVGFTTSEAIKRVKAQYPVLRPGKLPYTIVVEASAMRNDGSNFTDHDVHRHLKKMGIRRDKGEWFECTEKDVHAAIIAVRDGNLNVENRTLDFGLRPEQAEAVKRTKVYFERYKADNPTETPHFLWNAKMRFGKTFSSYQLAKQMNWTKVLVLTFKPAVQSAWDEDLKTHVDFEGWQFISKNGLSYANADKSKPYVCFASFQDFLGTNALGGIKFRNEWAHGINWDCVIFDEYHYGAWRESAKDLFEGESDKEKEFAEGKGLAEFKEENMTISTGAYLYLSGTPFRAIASGEFIEEQIFNWTYSDEQRAKEQWTGDKNPYASLPRMLMLTYQLPDAIREIALKGEFNEFDLNVFFSAKGEGESAKFTYENEVQKWLNLIRGSYVETAVDDLKLGTQKPPMPFSDARFLNILSHTFWFLPNVASCHAMKNLLAKRQNTFYHNYTVIVAAGTSAGIGMEALEPVKKAMHEPLKSKTITLSCGKLTTGVSIKPWSGILMLRNLSSPETYFQAAFRVQTPWTVKNTDNTSPNKEIIVKEECYVFDFAPDRALRQVADYSCRLNVGESNSEKKVEEFIHFLPVLAYDGSSMKLIDAKGILDMAMSGTTATLLARRWESALLVNVDNNTLKRLMDSEEAMKALMNIEGFRTINQDIEMIINKSNGLKKAKKEANENEPSKSVKKEMTEEEKKYRDLRKDIQDKLIKFAARIPVFMYLTDYREHCLTDVITQIEPVLFKKVTNLTVRDFQLLVSLNVFNSALMNDAIRKFRDYENASLEYIGINKHEGENIGLFNTNINFKDLNREFVNQ